MEEERIKVLQMLDEGKITVEEANELLSALQESKGSKKESLTEVSGVEEAKFLKILVTENEEEQVNISIPIKLVRMLKNFVPQKVKRRLEEEGVDMDELMSQIEQRTLNGKLVDIDDGKSHVEIKMVK